MTVNKNTLPWPELMRIGMGQLRMAPDQFWACTPKEFKAVLEGATGKSSEQTISRSILNDLIRQHPDNSDH